MITRDFDPAMAIFGFHVYRAENPAGPFQFLGKTDPNRFQDQRIKIGKTYYYRIGKTAGSSCSTPNTGPPLFRRAKRQALTKKSC